VTLPCVLESAVWLDPSAIDIQRLKIRVISRGSQKFLGAMIIVLNTGPPKTIQNKMPNHEYLCVLQTGVLQYPVDQSATRVWF
jgi:hypothetical protein